MPAVLTALGLLVGAGIVLALTAGRARAETRGDEEPEDDGQPARITEVVTGFEGEPEERKRVRSGESSPRVRAYQVNLNTVLSAAGFPLIGVDGKLGPETCGAGVFVADTLGQGDAHPNAQNFECLAFGYGGAAGPGGSPKLVTVGGCRLPSNAPEAARQACLAGSAETNPAVVSEHVRTLEGLGFALAAADLDARVRDLLGTHVTPV